MQKGGPMANEQIMQSCGTATWPRYGQQRVLWCIVAVALGAASAAWLLAAAGSPVRRAEAADQNRRGHPRLPRLRPNHPGLPRRRLSRQHARHPAQYVHHQCHLEHGGRPHRRRQCDGHPAGAGCGASAHRDRRGGQRRASLWGVTFRGGHSVGAACPAGCGGGVYIGGGAQPRLVNVAIRNNTADAHGGGLYAEGDLNFNQRAVLQQHGRLGRRRCGGQRGKR